MATGTLQIDDNMADADKLKMQNNIELVKSIKDVKDLIDVMSPFSKTQK